MNIAEYWSEKNTLLDNAFEGWQRKDEIQVRKLIIAKIMAIPENRVTYYINRDIWYLDFVLGDVSELDRTFVMKESTKEKVQEIIEEYFYKKDYEAICAIKIDKIRKDTLLERIKKMLCNNKKYDVIDKTFGRDRVCECIKKLVEDAIYKELSTSDKSMVDILEKILKWQLNKLPYN